MIAPTKRIAAVLAATVAVTVFTVVTTATAAPSHDQAVGTGTIGQFGNPTAHVNAIDTRKGWKGSFTIEYPDGTVVKGKVTCAFVSGNTAYVIGRVTESSGPRAATWPEGGYIVIGVQDNGEPGTSGVPDMLNFSPGLAVEPACAPNSAAIPVLPIVEGNFQVFDA